MATRQAAAINRSWRATRGETFLLALLRVAIGWHLAYEGLAKLWDSSWTSAGYLQSANWVGAEWFHRIAENPTLLHLVDLFNIWGLLLIGVALVLGLMTRPAAIAGALLLGLYYVAHPTLLAPVAGIEGHAVIVNKTLIEMIGLLVIAVRPAAELGLDGIWAAWRTRSLGKRQSVPADYSESQSLNRRQVLAGLTGVPMLGLFVMAALKQRGYRSSEEDQLALRIDAVSAPSMKPLQFETLDELKGKIPAAPIKEIEFSRVILGGNLMNGFAHARDLIYVSKLIKAYHHQEKVFETFKLAEACGINTILTNPILAPMITAYWEKAQGQIKFIAQCKGKTEQDLLDTVKYSIDQGACAGYVQGAAADRYVAEGHFDWIAKALELMRDHGLPAGIGGHHIATIKGCVDEGFQPDFWMKTLHHHGYWSARLDEQHDNMWCEDPDETVAFMETLSQPWIAFKVLAAGSIHPKDGFRYAFESGADFICVGMYDFQVVENANLALDTLASKLKRSRPWCA